jgi:hypothetical protein
MPSSKKNRSGRKGRKAAATIAADNNNNEGVVEQSVAAAAVEQLSLKDDAFLEEAIVLAAAEKKALDAAAAKKAKERIDGSKCKHGYDPSLIEERFCNNFMVKFMNAYNTSRKRFGGDRSLAEAFDNTLGKPCPKGPKEIATMERAASFCLSVGTQNVLDGYDDRARQDASFGCFFLEIIPTVMLGTKDQLDWPKIIELHDADEHSLISFFRKRIPCKCLDKKYKEVKSMKKMGLCYNPACGLPNRKAERSTMLQCTQCRIANYCSRECHAAEWPQHKEGCVKTAEATENVKKIVKIAT